MKTTLAPIVLFTYNRPTHTKKVLDSLALNNESKNSLLYIFCDGEKENTNEETIRNIIETKAIVFEENRFKKVIIKEHPKNKGLATSIIDGVTEILFKHESIIVLEDDILPSQGFLKYMNDALTLYHNDQQVGCIHSWNYNLNTDKYHETTFFLKGADCWGWATWRRAWKEFEPDGNKLLKDIKERNLEYDFNRRNTHQFIEILKKQINNKNDSWAIRWHASLYIKNMYCLHPTLPIAKNIGLDNSGVHCGEINLIQDPINFIELQRIPIKETDWFFDAYSEYLKINNHITESRWQKLKSYLKQLLLQ